MSSSKQLPGSKERLKKVTSTSSTSPTMTTLGVATLSKGTSMRSMGFVSPIDKTSSLVDEERGEDDSTANGSKPGNVWCNKHKLTSTSTGDQATVNLVVADRVFPKVKFVDRDTQLMFSHDKHSICQYVIRHCNLHSDIALPNWWKQVHIFVSQAINRLHNDRNTAMKWATLGKILALLILRREE
jgi:hypothetical protein